MKRVFGKFEAVFDFCYLGTATAIGILLLLGGKYMAGAMALILAGGDAFHLIPRIVAIRTGREEALTAALGRGKQITSVTMTVFYLLLWELANGLAPQPPGIIWETAVYGLAALRIILCLLPQNRWQEPEAPVKWGIWRNVPFFLLGLLVSLQFFWMRHGLQELRWVWMAVLLSFLFYLPVVLWADRNRKIGMLMLPKTCMYLWILVMFLRA